MDKSIGIEDGKEGLKLKSEKIKSMSDRKQQQLRDVCVFPLFAEREMGKALISSPPTKFYFSCSYILAFLCILIWISICYIYIQYLVGKYKCQFFRHRNNLLKNYKSISQIGFGVENMATAMDEDLEEELDEKDEKSMMCPPGMHKWKLEQCMVCTVCGDCTGYGASCVSSGRPDRVPGG